MAHSIEHVQEPVVAGWWRRVREFASFMATFEPATLRGIAASIVVIAGLVGYHLDLSPWVEPVIAVLVALVPLWQAISTRAVVVPETKYDAALEAATSPNDGAEVADEYDVHGDPTAFTPPDSAGVPPAPVPQADEADADADAPEES